MHLMHYCGDISLLYFCNCIVIFGSRAVSQMAFRLSRLVINEEMK